MQVHVKDDRDISDTFSVKAKKYNQDALPTAENLQVLA